MLQQLKESGVNMISDEYMKSLKTLEEGEVVYFQLLTGIPNNDPDLSERQKKPTLFGHVQIPTNDTIRDPFTNKPVKIAVVEDYDAKTGEVTRSRMFVPNMHLPQNPGIFALRGGDIQDEEMYAYLQICNYNRDAKGRDTKKEAMFYEINKKQPSNVSLAAKAAPKPVVINKKEAEPALV